jgi:hypothetical protein
MSENVVKPYIHTTTYISIHPLLIVGRVPTLRDTNSHSDNREESELQEQWMAKEVKYMYIRLV